MHNHLHQNRLNHPYVKLLCFLTFGFFSKCVFLWLRHFISLRTDPSYSIISVVVYILYISIYVCIIHVLNHEAYFLLAIVAMITEIMCFSFFMATFVSENLFIKSWNFLIHTILEKNGIRWIKSTEEKLSQRCIL